MIFRRGKYYDLQRETERGFRERVKYQCGYEQLRFDDMEDIQDFHKDLQEKRKKLIYEHFKIQRKPQ